MNPIGAGGYSNNTAQSIFSVISREITRNRSIGQIDWYDPDIEIVPYDGYKISVNIGEIWVSPYSKTAKGTTIYGILSALPNQNPQEMNVRQLLELNFQESFSNRRNTRLYEDGNTVEVRHYGKFVLGEPPGGFTFVKKPQLTRDDFFNWLRHNNHQNLIITDEKGKSYICVFQFDIRNLAQGYIEQQLAFYTLDIVKKFKDDMR